MIGVFFFSFFVGDVGIFLLGCCGIRGVFFIIFLIVDRDVFIIFLLVIFVLGIDKVDFFLLSLAVF